MQKPFISGVGFEPDEVQDEYFIFHRLQPGILLCEILFQKESMVFMW